MNRLQQKMLKLLDDTVEYYGEDTSRRAWTREGCQYLQEDTGNMCAVGRCMTKKGIKELGSFEGSYEELLKYTNWDNSFLYKKYQDIPFTFWEVIQDFHDSHTENYWGDESGLTTSGIERYNFIKSQIEAGAYQ